MTSGMEISLAAFVAAAAVRTASVGVSGVKKTLTFSGASTIECCAHANVPL